MSFATYFNAFPASYWRRWTSADSVRLSVGIDAAATITVYKSNARGVAQRVKFLEADAGDHVFDLPLAPFGDGGWYWFELQAGKSVTRMRYASWSVDERHARREGRTSIGITTFNRPDYCAAQLASFADDELLSSVVDKVYVVDQGTQLVSEKDDYVRAKEALGDRLVLVRQGNLGGSGGFSRSMLETVRAGTSDYLLLLDDDVVSEPEGIVRAATFADFCRKPTIVGGHMFSMYDKSLLHAFGERVQPYTFLWGAAPHTGSHDFGSHPLRTTPWLHRRVDVDYNGWWMCLIPVEVIKEVGLSLPVFIKWDDSEYALRARKAGFPTVSLPGSAVWHVPWTDKDDGIDWQAYYHQRNRWLAALLHSPYPRGGALLRQSFNVDVKHLLSLQYSAVELRLMALEDLLSGPDHLHESLGTQLGKIRSMRAEHPDALVKRTSDAFPDPVPVRLPRKGREPEPPRGRLGFVASAAAGVLRQLRPVDARTKEVPEALVEATAAKWWRLGHVDSAVVTSADGTGASMYVRDPELFRSYLARSVRLHQELATRWPQLLKRYRRAMPDFVSTEQWARTFEANTVDDDD
ncbi:glycosyltransferase [Litorihabitans aurantiacus]|uniref:glycosyltransferase n=1 Tax=Litorihabitans aurantiacus TaxID=1930061 RepID=UPI0024E05834|nr:glycosyltransferase [Litorihabitans aurantiacus]